jgi:hypothetical protein
MLPLIFNYIPIYLISLCLTPDFSDILSPPTGPQNPFCHLFQFLSMFHLQLQYAAQHHYT